ncbi:MAG: ATP phosphoribosyltransferase regulatory subunit [Schwartzia sp.]|nr:ATP phosphoribosyltransferase regulatory subunit [Schwartzia sp. (in: firmicutes)]
MEEKETAWGIPYGTRDFLPEEAREKRAVESFLIGEFARWGYDEVVTPTFEFLDTLTLGNGRRIEPRMFKLFDRANRTMALRHEMTTPIARVVASRMRDARLPLKLSYVSNVYRYEQAQAGRQCEFYQAGVEFMGSDAPAADAEIVALAASSMKGAGLKNFQICLGHVEFIHGLLEELRLDEADRAAARSALERHDLVGLRVLAERSGLSEIRREALLSVPLLHGGAEVTEKARGVAANERSRRALDDLASIYRLLEAYEVTEHVRFDLGIIRDFGYYTGMVFEAYTPGLGFPLCGGGRYDRMLSDFGSACPATGFALGIERVMLALEREGLKEEAPKKDVYISYAAAKAEDAIRLARERRAAGEMVELAPAEETRDAAALRQREKGYRSLVYLE